MKEDKDLVWTPVRVEHLVQDEWIDFRRVRYRYPDGREFEPFYQYSRRSYAVIVPILPDGRLLCVRQFRHGIGEVTTEFPAGGIEKLSGGRGDTQQGVSQEAGGVEKCRDVRTEDAMDAAKRELQEETGYESDQWTHLLTIPSDASLADDYAHIFLAENCRKVSGLHLDETEDLEPEILTAGDIEDLIRGGRFQQAVHVMAYLLAQRHLADRTGKPARKPRG